MNRPSTALMGSFALALAQLAGNASAAEGLRPPAEDALWAHWQTRVTLYSPSVPLPWALAGAGRATQGMAWPAGSVLGDVYLNTAGLRLPAALDGLRATGGLVFGARGLDGGPAGGDPAAEAADAGRTASYLGLGYSSRSAKGGWGLTADIGMLADGAASGGSRMLLGVQGQERSWRELRLSPLLQVGVRYAF